MSIKGIGIDMSKVISLFKQGVTAAAILSISAISANAQAVVLKANDGSVDIEGDLVSFEDGVYTIRTLLGEMRMSASRVSCEGAACPVIVLDQSDLTIAGSNTIGDELMPLLLTGYSDGLNAEADIQTGNDPTQKTVSIVGDQGYGDVLSSILISSTGSSDAFAALMEQTAEIGMASRRIQPSEARALRDNGAGNMISVEQERVIAVDSLLIIVHPSNPVDTLSIDQISDIYAGNIRNWSEVGGPDMPITVYSPEADSGTRITFEARTLDQRDYVLRADAQIVSDNISMSRSVVEDESAIGYAGYAFQRGAKSLNVVSECGIRSRPDAFSAKTEEYPFQRRLYVYNRSDNLSETAATLLEYFVSKEADSLVSKSGFIDLGVERTIQDTASGRMRGLIRTTEDPYELSLMRQLLVELLDWDRLSTTFRFASGSNRMDGKALRDLERLLDYLESLPSDTQIAVVGFTDNVGPFGANQTLSENRANEVMNIIRDTGGERVEHIDFTSLGFGPLSPAGCNETLAGQAVNRRVEIWIRG